MPTAEEDLAGLASGAPPPAASPSAFPSGVMADSLAQQPPPSVPGEPAFSQVPANGKEAATLAQSMPLPKADAPMTVPGAIRQSAKTADEGAGMAQVATTEEQKANKELAKLEGEEAKALRPSLEHQQAAAEKLATFRENTLKQYQMDYQQRMLDYQDTKKELEKVRAQLHPTDIFGAAGVSTVQGVIAMILGTIGGGLDGRNAGVERLDQLAQQRAQQFQQEAQLLEKRGGMEKNMFEFARQKLGDDTAAGLATYEAQLEAVKAEVQKVGNDFRSPRIRAEVAKTNAQLDMKLAAVQTQIAQFHGQLSSTDTIAMMQNQLQRSAMELKAATGPVKGLIAGYRGAIPEEGVHGKLSEVNQGAQTVFQELGRVIDRYKNGQISVSELRDLMAERALLSAPLRKFLLTGTRLEGQENADINALRPTLMESLAAKLAGDPLAVTRKLEAARVDIMRSAVEQTRVAGLVPDLNDPVMKDYYQLQAEQDQPLAAAKAVSLGVPRIKPNAPNAGVPHGNMFGD